MIAPLTPYAIRGAIWYQGESNRGAKDYFKKLQGLSKGWSKVFKVQQTQKSFSTDELKSPV
jgi:sialate O-acetylesterase